MIVAEGILQSLDLHELMQRHRKFSIDLVNG